MVNIPLFSGFYTSQVVQDFFHQQYHRWLAGSLRWISEASTTFQDGQILWSYFKPEFGTVPGAKRQTRGRFFLPGKFDGRFFFSDSLGPKVVVFLLDEYIGGEICDCGIFFGRWRGQITSRSGNERKRKFHFPWYVYYCIYIYIIYVSS